jgi:hypothetical protein
MPAAPASLALLIAVAASLALAAGSGGDSPVAGAPADGNGQRLYPAELARIAVERTPRVARRVERLRGLDFRSVPDPQLSDTDELRRLAGRELRREGAARELRADAIALRLLGLLEPEDDVKEIATDLTALAAAYYDPRREELAVVSDAVPAGPEVVEFVLAHELTHALEDERFGLPTATRISDDRYLAELALVEGTATALMIDYARRYLDPFSLGLQAAGIDPGDAGALPGFLEQQVQFTYLGGAEFVDQLRLAADPAGAWRLVDRAYRHQRPLTTEQVLHPGKYFARERALPVGPGEDPGPGWEEVDEDVIGEFFTAQILRVGLPGEVAERAVAGWGGDRYWLWRRGTDHSLLAVWRWDTVADAREFTGALARYVAAGLGGDPRSGPRWALTGGFAAIGAGGDSVTLALAPTSAIAGRLADD